MPVLDVMCNHKWKNSSFKTELHQAKEKQQSFYKRPIN